MDGCTDRARQAADGGGEFFSPFDADSTRRPTVASAACRTPVPCPVARIHVVVAAAVALLGDARRKKTPPPPN